MPKTIHPKIRRFELCIDKVKTLEDIKKILNCMNFRIETNHPKWDDVEDYFCLEVVPNGYMKLVDKIGWEGIAELHFHEIEEQAAALLEELENNEEKN